jgi:hypothetical protein
MVDVQSAPDIVFGRGHTTYATLSTPVPGSLPINSPAAAPEAGAQLRVVPVAVEPVDQFGDPAPQGTRS